MKQIAPLINSINQELLSIPELQPLLGVFSNSEDALYNPVAIAYGNLPSNYTVPNSDKLFIIFNLESAVPIQSETKAYLQRLSLKMYLGGIVAPEAVDLIVGHFEGKQIYNYYVNQSGILQLQTGDITLRFNLI